MNFFLNRDNTESIKQRIWVFILYKKKTALCRAV